MPPATMEWVGKHTYTDDEGQIVTVPMPTHVEVGVYIKAFKMLYGNGWVQIPVKMTTYEGLHYIGIGNLKKALQYTIKFLQNYVLHIYKGNCAQVQYTFPQAPGTYDTIAIDTRPGSVHSAEAGQDTPRPLENNQYMRPSSYFILEIEERDKTVAYKVSLDTFEHYFTVYMKPHMDTIADLKKALIEHLYPNSPIYNYMDGYEMDRITVHSAATEELMEPEEKLQWDHSHLATKAGKEYMIKLYKQEGGQYTMADYLDGHVEYPPPRSTHSTGYDHDYPDDDNHTDGPITKRRRYT